MAGHHELFIAIITSYKYARLRLVWHTLAVNIKQTVRHGVQHSFQHRFDRAKVENKSISSEAYTSYQ